MGPTLYVVRDTVAAWNRRTSSWISVEERLPEEGQQCGPHMGLAEWSGGEWQADGECGNVLVIRTPPGM